MTTKRRPLNRSQGPAITDEMVELFKRGCELQAAGHGDIDDKSPEHDEFIQIAKRLEWALVQLPSHACSVFDPALDRKQPLFAPSTPCCATDTSASACEKALVVELFSSARVPSP
jgi:hypothetical protein